MWRESASQHMLGQVGEGALVVATSETSGRYLKQIADADQPARTRAPM
jgi:hypothetical protein